MEQDPDKKTGGNHVRETGLGQLPSRLLRLLIQEQVEPRFRHDPRQEPIERARQAFERLSPTQQARRIRLHASGVFNLYPLLGKDYRMSPDVVLTESEAAQFGVAPAASVRLQQRVRGLGSPVGEPQLVQLRPRQLTVPVLDMTQDRLESITDSQRAVVFGVVDRIVLLAFSAMTQQGSE